MSHIVCWGRETAIRNLMDHRREKRPHDSEYSYDQYHHAITHMPDTGLQNLVQNTLFGSRENTVFRLMPNAKDVVYTRTPKIEPICPVARPH